ncbi:MAG: DUF6338 family protein [Planctomycetales bacterium]|nr:DUF6338 family protein [Planctomycetales bacterium]
MELSSLEAVFYAINFLVPGFIIELMLSALVPRRTEPEKLLLVRFLTFSCLNHALWSWLIILVLQAEFFTKHPIRSAIAWAVVILISPILLGLLIGCLHQRNLIRKALQRLGFNPLHVIPTSWDWKFSNIQQPVWVLVTLMDGSSVCGLFGSGSFASTDPQDRDLYIQEVWRHNKDGRSLIVERTDGIIIRGDSIKHIEFWRDEDE